MEVIFQTGGKQYKASKGQKLSVNKLPADIDAQVSFDSLATIDGDSINTAQGKVTAKILRHYKDKKVVVSTYKRRKGLHNKRGHRQQLTEIEISDIKA